MAETRRRIAERVVDNWYESVKSNTTIVAGDYHVLTLAIETALAERDERAASIAAGHVVAGHNGQPCGAPGTMACGIYICAKIQSEEA